MYTKVGRLNSLINTGRALTSIATYGVSTNSVLKTEQPHIGFDYSAEDFCRTNYTLEEAITTNWHA